LKGTVKATVNSHLVHFVLVFSNVASVPTHQPRGYIHHHLGHHPGDQCLSV